MPFGAMESNCCDPLIGDQLRVFRQSLQHLVGEHLNATSPRIVEVNLMSVTLFELTSCPREYVLGWRLRNAAYHLEVKKSRIVLPDLAVVWSQICIRDT